MTTSPPLRSPADYPDFPVDPHLGFSPPGADGMVTAVPALMGIVITVFLIIVAVTLFRAGRTFAANSSSPTATVPARVVAKRTHTEGGAGDTPVRTLYYATFQTTGGDRVEVKVPRGDYGQLVEGDEGRLTHQGTWYRGFQRDPVAAVDEFWEAPGGPFPLEPPSPG